MTWTVFILALAFAAVVVNRSRNPLAKYANDFMAFAADLHVPLGAGSGRLGDNWADFQRKDFEALAPSLVALARGEVPPTRRFWIERTKGGSKDSDVTVAILWLLAFAPRSVRVQVGAYDREQASELRYIAKAILGIDSPLNQKLLEVIDVQAYRIVAHANTAGRPESVCELLTTDAYGSHGSRPDLVVANELSHVGSETFMQTLFDNADKIPHSLVVVATNSGEIGSWQENWRNIAQESPRWHFSVLNRPSPWTSDEDLAESRKRNPPHRFLRLWYGIWSSGDGDGLNPADITACTTLAGPQQWRNDRIYVVGLDLGVKNDRSALIVLAADHINGVVELALAMSWRPQDHGGVVDLEIVKQAVEDVNRLYKPQCVAYDPWQAHLMAQQLEREGVNMREWVFNSQNKDLMARSLLEAFTNRLVAIYPDKELERDLLRLQIKEVPHMGFRLDAVKDDDGHADRAIAFSMVLPVALHVARECVMDEPPQEETLVA